MKTFVTLLALLSSLSAFSYEHPKDGPMTKAQSEYLRFNGVSINITHVNDRLLSRRATASYEASLTNPYTRGIKCNIEITSSRGTNGRYEVIANKTHFAIYAPARSTHVVSGSIEIKHGRGDDGLQWVESKGHLVKASSCHFVD